ncbi:alpha/beta fold hydrolase [Nocardioides sp. CFH 31398]|uniref:alpha/beta fold hydrolase n=1 Tax=Nocardioides sp. CFH 31398 TaxID=2919579 RepID=UPI001F060593|nr:alpha/beta hydrolase [Nocardioides sp. CFH 31398]MCH1868404.1 alpha/beta hydrolase [Nocardioides sp. CFH 31398]
MTTRTVAVPGATLTYDVHGELAPGVTPLVLAASPMDASGFETLRSHFTDRVVVTYDPRNTGRSVRDEPTAGVSPEEHADDLHAVLADLGSGPVDLFGSSGGAVNGLHLVARHPDDVRLLVAHEPPAANVLGDEAEVAAVCDDMVATYDAHGVGPAMAKFIAFVMHRGPTPPDHLEQPAPEPAAFGLPTEDDGSRNDPLMSNLRGGNVHRGLPDVEAVSRAATRVVVAVGEESGGPDDGEMPARAAYGVAAALGQEVVVFPSHHAGFLGGEFGQTGEPEAFAVRLRDVLERAG